MATYGVDGVSIPVNSPNNRAALNQLQNALQFTEYFFADTCLKDITSTQLTGNLTTKGSELVVPVMPDDTLFETYQDGADLTPEVLEFTTKKLVIDKAIAKAVKFPTIEAKQAAFNYRGEVDKWIPKKMAENIEYGLLNANYATADAANMGATAGKVSQQFNMGVSGTPRTLTKSTVLQFFTEMQAVLRENRAPMRGNFFVVVPPIVALLLQNSGLTYAYQTGDAKSPIRTNAIGSVWGFDIYVSQLLAPITDGSDTCYYLTFGSRDAVSFAMQLNQKETVLSSTQLGFYDIGKWLMVYGYKTFLPKALGAAYVKVDLSA